MASFQLIDYSVTVGSSVLVDSANVRVVEGQRVALVGPNGSGKSTLMRALAHSFRDDEDYYVVSSGRVAGPLLAADSSVLYVEQDDLQWSHLLGGDEETLRDYPLLDALDISLVEGNSFAQDDAQSWRKLLAAAQDTLGWRTAHYDTTPLGQLSPGCAMRAYLAVALHRPGSALLFLDEPTNHLDLPSILWLQNTIMATTKTIVMVSHDAAFLDAVCDHVWAIDGVKKTLTMSGARYTDYCAALELAREQQQEAYEAQEKRDKKLAAVANKLRDASSAGAQCVAPDRDKLQNDFRRDRAGRSGKKAKAIDKMRERGPHVERVTLRKPLVIDIDALGAGVGSTMMLDEVVLGYPGSDPLPLPPLSLRVDFGDRVAIVGFNGAGKSTMLKTLLGELQPVSGTASIGRELRVGNLTQEHENLPRDKTPTEHFSKLTGRAPAETIQRLIRYGLTRRQVDCPIGALNPGARARALLAGFAMLKVNALILDEPTNHLDQEAVEEVESTLSTYPGTVLIVTHNRQFLEALKLTKVMRLSIDGLAEVESLGSFIGDVDDAAAAVVAKAMGV